MENICENVSDFLYSKLFQISPPTAEDRSVEKSWRTNLDFGFIRRSVSRKAFVSISTILIFESILVLHHFNCKDFTFWRKKRILNFRGTI